MSNVARQIGVVTLIGFGVAGFAGLVRAQTQECRPLGNSAVVAYQASAREVVVVTFPDPVYGLIGQRLSVDISASDIVLPRGVWWVNVQPMDLSPSGDAFYQVWDYETRLGGDVHVKDGALEHKWRYTDRGSQWDWYSIRFEGPGDAAIKVGTTEGRVIHDTLFITDNRDYDNAVWNMISGRGVFGGLYDVQAADDFVVREREARIGTVVADFLTILGNPPADGVWVQFYGNLCPTPILDPPVPGRAGEVNEWHITDLRPADVVHFVYGLAPGEFRIPGCGSIGVNIANPVYMGSATADVEGNAVFARFVPVDARGRTILMQALQRTTCLTSNVVEHTFE